MTVENMLAYDLIAADGHFAIVSSS